MSKLDLIRMAGLNELEMGQVMVYKQFAHAVKLWVNNRSNWSKCGSKSNLSKSTCGFGWGSSKGWVGHTSSQIC